MQTFERELEELRSKDLLRDLATVKGIDFASNDYLGFSQNPRIRAKLLQFIEENARIGATGSRLVTGNSMFIESCEAWIAKIFSAESALIYGSGYLANLGVLSALGADHDTAFFSDALNHASIIDGIRLGRSPCHIFPHNDLDALEEALKTSSAKRKIVVTESVFSMDGDLAPVASLALLAEKYGAYLVLDEAHATGTVGAEGLGLAKEIHAGAWPNLIALHTCGKALGAYGAIVTCNKRLRDFLINRSRTFIYSTALPPYLVAQIRFAVKELVDEPAHLESLRNRVALCRELFKQAGLPHSGTPIVPVVVGSNQKAIACAESLKARGLFTRAIRYPSVPENCARVRITLRANHSDAEIHQLSLALKEFIDAPFH